MTFEFTNDLIFTAYNENLKPIYEERYANHEEQPINNIFSFISKKANAIFENFSEATLIQLSIDGDDETVFANLYREVE